jgi:hypothetical protein
MANWGRALAEGLGIAINTENERFATQWAENDKLAKQRYEVEFKQSQEDARTLKAAQDAFRSSVDKRSKFVAVTNYNNRNLPAAVQAKLIEDGLKTGGVVDAGFLDKKVNIPAFNPNGYKEHLRGVDKKQFPLGRTITKVVTPAVEAAQEFLPGGRTEIRDTITTTTEAPKPTPTVDERNLITFGGTPDAPTTVQQKVSAVETASRKFNDPNASDADKATAFAVMKSLGAVESINKNTETFSLQTMYNAESGQTISANYDKQDAELFTRDDDGNKIILNQQDWTKVATVSPDRPTGSKEGLNKAIESGRLHSTASTSYVRSIEKVVASITTSEFAGAKASTAIIKTVSNMGVELAALTSTFDGTPLGELVNGLQEDTINDDSKWEIDGVDSQLLASTEYREGIMALTYASLAIKGQTGKAVSNQEFEAQRTALAADMADPKLIRAKMIGLLEDGIVANDDFFESGVATSFKGDVNREFPQADIKATYQEALDQISGKALAQDPRLTATIAGFNNLPREQQIAMWPRLSPEMKRHLSSPL